MPVLQRLSQANTATLLNVVSIHPYTFITPYKVQVILRQGVSTLVTTVNTYKVLALSSIIQAYSLATLNYESLKFSEL